MNFSISTSSVKLTEGLIPVRNLPVTNPPELGEKS